MDLSSLAPTSPIVLSAVALDALLGDPVYPLHPVRLIGRTLSVFEVWLHKIRLAGYVGGCLLLLLLAMVWVVVPCVLIVEVNKYSPMAAWAVHLFLVYSLIALRDLLRHGWAVESALRRDDISGARYAVSLLVGRDTQPMDAAACRRAVIESLAENVVDGFASPLFWYALVGLPGLLLFKVVSTMDSMVGYKTPRYLRFGWCGARSDDLMNWLPARFTWLVMTVAAFVLPEASAAKAVRIGWRQHALVPGPNSGWSEATIAGALQRRLVGPIWQDGQLVTSVWLGDAPDPEAGLPDDFTNACYFLIIVSAGWIAIIVTFLACSSSIDLATPH
ncbi:MAG: cobalamin biosynthesis protein CobD [Deltaproteobacteria bacterium]|nr:cobalamin biosynthesis protein CobD [Deltaproteobacteria bacterium]